MARCGMGVGIVCTPRVEVKLKLTLQKDCPKCGTCNTLPDMGSTIRIIPLCHVCGTALWDTKDSYIRFWNGQVELVQRKAKQLTK